MKPFFITLFASLLTVMAVIYSADPAARWHRATLFSARDLKEPEVWVYPQANWDERKVKGKHIALIDRPDIFVAGSSRGVFVQSRMFRPELKLFNAGVSGATIEDAIVFWQMLKEQKKTPRAFLLLIDPWVFNKNSGQTRWRTHADVYTRFFQNAPERSALETAWEKIQGLKDDFHELLSWKQLQASVKYFASGETSVQQLGFLTTEDRRPAHQTGYRWDGSSFYTVEAVKPKPLDEIRKIALQYASDGAVYNLGAWEFDPASVRNFELLIRDVLAHGTRLMVVIPPYQPVAYQTIRQRPGYSHIFDEFRASLAQSMSHYPSAQSCDAMDPSTIGCTDTEFMDGMHSLEPCVSKLLQGCFARHPEWKALLR